MGGLPAAERIDDIVDKIQQLVDQGAGVHLFYFPEVDEIAVDTIAAGPPFVLVYQGARILDIVHVLQTELIDLYADGLEERGDAHRLVDGHRHIADAELHGIEEGMYAQVPPDLLCIVDAIGLYEQFYKIVIGLDAFKVFGDARAGEFVKYFCPVGLVSREPSFPEGGVGAEGIDM